MTLDADGSQVPSLQPVDTTTAAFVGEHPPGPLDRPVLVTSARDLKRTFGSARCRLLRAPGGLFLPR